MPVHAVLLVPHEGDPLGLLANGPCGARPPTRAESPEIEGRPRWVSEAKLNEYDLLRRRGAQWVPPFDWEDARRALVLAWDGKPVADGVWRLANRFTINVYSLDAQVRGWLSGEASPVRDASCGDFILSDEHGREITP